jgi:hypothetical protein
MRHITLLIAAILISFSLSAQSSLPAPGGSTGNSLPSPGATTWGNPDWNGPNWGMSGPNWGSPWGPPPPMSNPSWSPNAYGDGWQQGGNLTVLACGYDAQGVWRVIPLRVNYDYNGIQYDVEVINAYNPWSDTWNMGVDVPAVNTSYYLRGNYYDFYVVLSTGTFYFNL